MDKKSALDDWLEEEMRDPEFREIWERTSPQVNFGLALAMMREQRGMTQQHLADASGIGRSVIARMEKGDHAPTLVTQTKLARALHARLEVPPNGQVRFVSVRGMKRATRAPRARKAAAA
ncbi:MAG: helix-turn-helix transcriptional regulator [Thermomicrobiales bacterium]